MTRNQLAGFMLAWLWAVASASVLLGACPSTRITGHLNLPSSATAKNIRLEVTPSTQFYVTDTVTPTILHYVGTHTQTISVTTSLDFTLVPNTGSGNTPDSTYYTVRVFSGSPQPYTCNITVPTTPSSVQFASCVDMDSPPTPTILYMPITGGTFTGAITFGAGYFIAGTDWGTVYQSPTQGITTTAGPGTSGYVLTSNGAGTGPTYQEPTINTTVNSGSTYFTTKRLRVNGGTGITITQSSSSGTTDVTVTSSSSGLGSSVSGGYVTRSGSNLLFAPDKSNRFFCYESSTWTQKTIPDAGVTVACTSLGNTNTAYYLYGYDNAGTVTLDLSTTGTVNQNGIPVKSGATARTLLAYCRADEAGNVVTPTQNVSRCFITNLYNQREVALRCLDLTDSWTYNGGTFRQANASIANQCEFISDGKSAFWSTLYARAANTASGRAGFRIAVNGGGTNDLKNLIGNAAVEEGQGVAVLSQVVSQGHLTLVWQEVASGTTLTFYGDNGNANTYASGLMVVTKQ